MAQVAHIRYEGGALLLPAQDPYEREVVFQEAEFCARRHGSVGVQLGRREVRISMCTADARRRCASCRNFVGAMSFVVDRHLFCSHCAKQSLGCDGR